jgi:hypothetical protein
MADGLFSPYIGNPNIARQVARARQLEQQRSAETLPDPKTYGFTQGLLGTRPDQLGMSVLSENTQPVRQAAELGFAANTALSVAPMVQGISRSAKSLSEMIQQMRGVPVAAENVAPLMGYHRTTIPFEGDFVNTKNKLGVSFAGDRGFYFSPELNDPTADIFGKHIIAANIAVKNPAPVYQVNSGMTNTQTPRSIIQVDKNWLKQNPESIREGGLAIANSLEDVIAGKTIGRSGSFKEYEEQVKQAAKTKKLFVLIDPEKLYAKQVDLLEKKGYDGFNYVRPESATSSMPSQIVALRPEQINRLASGREENILKELQSPTYADPFVDTTR